MATARARRWLETATPMPPWINSGSVASAPRVRVALLTVLLGVLLGVCRLPDSMDALVSAPTEASDMRHGTECHISTDMRRPTTTTWGGHGGRGLAGCGYA